MIVIESSQENRKQAFNPRVYTPARYVYRDYPRCGSKRPPRSRCLMAEAHVKRLAATSANHCLEKKRKITSKPPAPLCVASHKPHELTSSSCPKDRRYVLGNNLPPCRQTHHSISSNVISSCGLCSNRSTSSLPPAPPPCTPAACSDNVTASIGCIAVEDGSSVGVGVVMGER